MPGSSTSGVTVPSSRQARVASRRRRRVSRRTIGDVAHALRHRGILRKDAVNTGEADGPLRFPVDQLVVALIGDRAPAAEPVGRAPSIKHLLPAMVQRA